MPPSRPAPFEPNQLWQRASEPIFWLDPLLILVWVNPAWEKLTGYPANAVVGLACLAHGESRPGDVGDLVASFYPAPECLVGEPAGRLSLIFHASGTASWHRLEFWPWRDEHKALIGILGLVRPADAALSVVDSRASRLHTELLLIRQRLLERYGSHHLIGFGPSHKRLLDQISLASSTMTPVLIVGEPGTGKRLVARTIHQSGPRNQQPFIPFDCEALPVEILERELFGEKKDHEVDLEIAPARTGSISPRLRLRDGSTLLIREVTMLPRELQERLAASLGTSFRLLATTTLDPRNAWESEQLRSELYFALTTLVIQLQPLRDRRADVPALAQYLLERTNERGGKQKAGFSSQAISTLMAYDWPGNVRELARVIDSAHNESSDREPLIGAEDLPASVRGHVGGGYLPPAEPITIKPLDELLMEFERRLIESALSRARRNKSRAADLLGISRPRLYRRIKELGLPDAETGDEPGDQTARIDRSSPSGL